MSGPVLFAGEIRVKSFWRLDLCGDPLVHPFAIDWRRHAMGLAAGLTGRRSVRGQLGDSDQHAVGDNLRSRDV